jgi:hypothetical protein
MNIAEIRQQYPQYSDLSDAQLAGALHQKYYSDMSLEEFSTKAGLKAPKAEDKRSFMEKGRDAFVASPFGRFSAGVATPALGLAQMAVEPFAGGDSNPVTQKLRQLQEMQKAGGHEGMDIAGGVGQVIGPMGVTSKIPMAASLVGKVAQGAGIGAGTAMTQPVMEGSVFGAKPGQAVSGGVLGAAIPPLVAGAGKGYEVARNLADPFLPGGAERVAGRIANAAAGDKQPQVVAELLRNRQMVPGSQATAGEVAAPAGSAEFSGLQRIVESLRPSDYVARANTQDAARVAAVRSVGKDKATLEAAEATRAGHATANYQAAYQQAVKADPELALLAKNPFFKDAVPDAIKLAEANGINPKTDMTKFLHYVKISMDDTLDRTTGDKALGESQRRTAQMVKERLVDWIAKKNPAYDKARDTFAKDSVPINQMEVGQFLEGKLTPAVDTAKQRASVYSDALREAPRTLKRATGFKGHDELSDVLTKPQENVVRGVASDLSRHAQHEQLASAGRQRASDIISETLPAAPASGMFSPTYSVIRAVLNNLTGKASSKALDVLAERMKDPAELAKVMNQLPPAQRAKIIQDMLQRSGGVVGGAAQ